MPPDNLLYHYQTFAGGVLALVSAAATVYYLHRQIAQQDRLEDERRRRRYDAARAVMPLALSGLWEYAEGCAAALIELRSRLGDRPSLAQSDELPTFPEAPAHLVPVVGQIVEHGKPAIAATFAALLTDLQLQKVRLPTAARRGLRESEIVTTDNVEQSIVEALVLLAKADRLFRYARHETDRLPDPPEAKAVQNMLAFRGLDAGHYPKLHRLVEGHLSREPGDGEDCSPPWWLRPAPLPRERLWPRSER